MNMRNPLKQLDHEINNFITTYKFVFPNHLLPNNISIRFKARGVCTLGKFTSSVYCCIHIDYWGMCDQVQDTQIKAPTGIN